MIVSVGPDIQYFIGSFDGQTFKNENSNVTELWVDYGPDSYAGITYNMLPDKRRIFVSWMNRWEYAASLNFSVWNGQMSIARELKLHADADARRLRLASLPVREIESLRVKRVHSIQNISMGSNSTFKLGSLSDGNERHLLDAEITVDLVRFQAKDDALEIKFAGVEQELSVLFTGNEFVLNRTNAVRKDFNANFGRVWKAPRHINSSILRLRIIIDRSSIELYADDGLTVMAALYYSDEDIASNFNVYHRSAKSDAVINLIELNVYQMKSIWN